jgi:hypothetical protein
VVNLLFRPFSYLLIDHPKKWLVDWLYPLVLCASTIVVLGYLRTRGTVVIFSDAGLVSKCLGFIQGLPGFYIAALAAIATFNKTDIDKTMPAPVPSLTSIYKGEKVVIKLTRRRFLCSMFAFLTAESIVLVLMSVFAPATASSFKGWIGGDLESVTVYIFLIFYFFAFWQMIVTTFLGLYYLGERLHQADAV